MVVVVKIVLIYKLLKCFLRGLYQFTFCMLLKVLLKNTTIIGFSVQKDLVIDNMLKALDVGTSSAFNLTFKQFYKNNSILN